MSVRQRIPKPLRDWMDSHQDRDFVANAVAGRYLQKMFPGLLFTCHGLRGGEPVLAGTGLATRFVYDLWKAEAAGDGRSLEDMLKDVAEWYGVDSIEKIRAACEYEAWVRGERISL